MRYPIHRAITEQGGVGYSKASFRYRPVCALATGGAASGATGAVNMMAFPDTVFEYCVLGIGQTIVAPVLTTLGLNAALDLTADEGLEITQGITSRSPVAFTVGGPPFYAELDLAIADVSGTDDCAFGFRKAAAYTAAIDDYTDFAVLNAILGAIKIETALNNAATTTTDTTDTWVDGAQKTLGVYVSTAGLVTYKINGAAPTTVAAFTADAGDVMIPFFYFLHDVTAPGAITLAGYRAGYQ